MWHEARKQERKIRGMLVDYRKRAERRQDFYEKIKADPTQFIQLHGRRCKIHLDPAIAAAGESPAIMMPWQGQHDNLIDRFDVRAHLDYIQPIPKRPETEELNAEERQCNYESYRILAQNDFLVISEEKYLHQLHLEEQFGVSATQIDSEKSKKKSTGVAIGYNYDDDGNTGDIQTAPAAPIVQPAGGNSDDSDSDIDVDVAIDISKIDTNQAHELNTFGRNYGMLSNDFYSYLTKDADEAEALRMAREEEHEKIMLSGRKSRRERRAQRERRFLGRQISPPSYAAKEEPTTVHEDDKNDSDSRSPSPENSGKITYITSFGGEDELQPHSKISINFNKQQKGTTIRPIGGPTGSQGPPSYADKVKENLDKLKSLNSRKSRSRSLSASPKKPLAYRNYTKSSSRDRSRRSPFDRRKAYGRSHSRNRRNSRSPSYRRYRSSAGRDDKRRDNRDSRRRRRSSTSSSSTSSENSRKGRSSRASRGKGTRQKRYRSPSSSSTSSSSTSSCRSRSISRRKSIPIQKCSKSTIKNSDISISKPIQSLDVPLNANKQLDVPLIISIPPIQLLPVPMPSVLLLPPPPPSLTIPPATEIKLPEPQVPIKKYYGRKRDNQSSSEEELNMEDEDGEKANSDSSTLTKCSAIIGKPSGTIQIKSTAAMSSSGSKQFNPRDRLKRKMQILLNKQYKADKLAEIEKTERQVQQQQEREDEMREMALRLRRRQRELRHKYGSPTSSHSDGDTDSKDNDDNDDKHSRNGSRNHSTSRSIKQTKSRSRSKSRSPKRRCSTSRRSTSRRSSSRRSRSHGSRSQRRTSRSRDRTNRSRDRSQNRQRDRRSPGNGNRGGGNSRNNRPTRGERFTGKLVDY